MKSNLVAGWQMKGANLSSKKRRVGEIASGHFDWKWIMRKQMPLYDIH